ncbi:hypothetical protein ACVWZ4_000997 [Bradyrhizobium sp. USDA 4472]
MRTQPFREPAADQWGVVWRVVNEEMDIASARDGGLDRVEGLGEFAAR